jgi:hypothetical protein
MANALKARQKPSRVVGLRKNSANRPPKTAPIKIMSVEKSGSTLTIGFDQAVSLKGVPQYEVDVAGVTPTGAALADAMTITVTFSGAITAATEVRIPYEEPAVRNGSGGFVSTSTFPVS